MAKARVGAGLVAGLLLLGAGRAAAQMPTVAQMLDIRPQQDVTGYGTPAPGEHKDCEVKLEQGRRPGSSGYVLLDGKKQAVRRFFDTNGDKKIDVWSYC